MIFEIPHSDLINRGLNTKAQDQFRQVNTYLKEAVNDLVKAEAKTRNPEWHYINIRYSSSSDTYKVEVSLGEGIKKG